LKKSIEWLEQDNIPNRYQILMVWIELNCDEMCDSFIHYLPKIEKRGLEPIWDQLKKKPWWGDYKPALFMTGRKAYPVNIKVAQLLTYHLDNAAVKNHLLNLLRDPDFSLGQHLATSYVANTSREDFPMLYQILCDTSPGTASGIYQAMHQRDHDLAVQWLLDSPQNLPTQTLRNMIALNVLNHNEPRQEELLNLYLQRFNSNTSDNVREVIMEELRPYCNDLSNWRTAVALNMSLVAPEKAKEFQSLLLSNARRLPFEERTAFRLKLIEQYAEQDYQQYLKTLKDHPESRNNPFTFGITMYATGHLLDDDPLEGQYLKKLSDFVLSRPHDYNLQHYLIRDCYKQEWDWGCKEVMDMVKLASAHPRAFSRGQLLEQIKSLDPETQRKYAPIIRDRLRKETEKANIQILEKLRASLEL